MRPLLMLGLLVAVAFAGCLGGGDTMTAKDGLDKATDTAKAWTDGPGLVGVMSVEPFKRMFEAGEGEVLVHLDGSQGDGRAPAWVYLYQGVDRLVFVVNAAGLGILAEGWMSEDDWGLDEDAVVIEGWKIDSDEAADALADHPDWPEAAEDLMVFWGLTMEDGEPYWQVEAENMTSTWTARVHAGNGTVMEVEEQVWEDWDEWYEENDRASATLTPLAPSLSVTVTLGGPGDLVVYADNSVTLGSISTTLTGPDGFFVELEDFTPYETWPDLPEGAYTLTAQIDSPATIGDAQLELQGYWYE